MSINEFIKFLKSFKKENGLDGHQELRFLMMEDDILLTLDEVFCSEELGNPCYLSFSANFDDEDGTVDDEEQTEPTEESVPNNVIHLLSHQKEQTNASSTVEW